MADIVDSLLNKSLIHMIRGRSILPRSHLNGLLFCQVKEKMIISSNPQRYATHYLRGRPLMIWGGGGKIEN